MPRRYRRRKRGKRLPRRVAKKKYTISIGKLRSKKVDSLLERRIVDLATKHDRKNIVYYKPLSQLAAQPFVGANWTAHGQVLHVPTASYLSINAATLLGTRLSDFGDWINNNTDSASAVALRTNYIRCKAMKNRLSFRHHGVAPIKIYIWIYSMSGAELLSASTAVPSITTFPFVGNGLYAHVRSALKETLQYQYTVHKKRMITIPAGKVYTPPYPANNNNATVWSEPVYSERERTVNFDMYFKNRGKRFLVEAGAARPKTREYFLCITADGAFDVLGSLSQTIYLDKASARSMLAQQP